ncbi:MAG TPA: VTT domain-containing protein [Acidobacteriaceae bacterium]|nr:VTT domain-containing protein [Acidobacteriaceae bacterium]
MKQLLAKLMQRWNVLIVPALIKMGFWGVGLIAIADSSTIPVPMDALLAVMVWENKSLFWLYCLAGAAGSAIGGLLPYGLGRAGGELFLLKRVNRERFEKMRNRFERQEFLAVLVPSMLPPPTPWKAFVFAAGVFEMRVAPFMLAVFCGRLVRWGILSLLVIELGPSAVSLMNNAIKNHLTSLLGAIVLIFVAIGVWVVVKRRKAKSLPAPEA